MVNQIWAYQSITYGSEPLNWYHLCELVSSLPLNSWSNILPKKIFMSQSNAERNFSGGPLKQFWELRCIKPCFPTFLAVWLPSGMVTVNDATVKKALSIQLKPNLINLNKFYDIQVIYRLYTFIKKFII